VHDVRAQTVLAESDANKEGHRVMKKETAEFIDILAEGLFESEAERQECLAYIQELTKEDENLGQLILNAIKCADECVTAARAYKARQQNVS
jgi:hypothetical protein